MAELTIDLRKAVLCSECKHTVLSTIPCAYNCINKLSPCRNRVVYADFGCTYGEKKEHT